ncbi:MAG TPA: hypothetical protein VI911_09060 [Patescibacteria group bacterium]|nr:MAG: putative-Protein [candidate division TM6 bacterium GW2011_GWF2_33_332]HLD91147.1 hypothetical protein [Patescibacteria group bacterium]
MKQQVTQNSNGIGFIGLLTIVFITLKLCGVIAWSWWWVLSPILLSTGIAIIILIVMFLILMLAK